MQYTVVREAGGSNMNPNRSRSTAGGTVIQKHPPYGGLIYSIDLWGGVNISEIYTWLLNLDLYS